MKKLCCCNFGKFVFCGYRIVVTFFLFYTFIGGGIIGPLTGPTLPDLAKFMGETETVVSFVFSAKALGIITGSFLMGRVSDLALKPTGCLFSHNLFKLQFVGVCLHTLPCFLFPIVPWLSACLLFHFFCGMGWSTMVVSSTMIVRVIYPAKWWSSVLQAMFFNFGFGGFVFPFFIGIVFYGNFTPQVNLIIIYFSAALISIFAALLLFFPPPKLKNEGYEVDRGENIEEKRLNKIEDLGDSSSSVLSEVELENKDPKLYFSKYKFTKCTYQTLWKMFKKFDFLRLLFVLNGSVSIIFVVAVDVTFQAGIFSYTVNLGWDRSLASYMNSVYFLSYTIGRLFGVVELYIISDVQMLFIHVSAQVISMMVLLFFSTNTVVIILVIISMGFFNSTCYGSMFVVSNCFEIYLTGLESSLILGFGATGFFITTITTIIVDQTSRIIFVVLILLYCVLMLCSWYFQYAIGTLYLHRNKKKKCNENNENNERNIEKSVGKVNFSKRMD